MPNVPPRPKFAACAILCLAVMALGPGGASGETPAPGRVIGYASADRQGASQAWDLPPDKPYLYVPALPASLGGKIAVIDTGPEVGAVLFRAPYFTSRDPGCQPALGSVRRPDLAWLGATARFAPAPEGQADDSAAAAGPDGYGSLIVYRSDLGPPPGVLMLDRRVTLGLRCPNPVHKMVYNRIFVPVAEAPEAERCFDLAGNYPGTKDPVRLSFLKSERLVLLMPGDMAERYAPIRHDITVTLFENLACAGESVTLGSRANAPRDVRLNDLDFRDRARSIRLTYDYGNADAFLVRRTAPSRAAVPEARAQAQATGPSPDASPAEPLLAVEPIGDPRIERADRAAAQAGAAQAGAAEGAAEGATEAPATQAPVSQAPASQAPGAAIAPKPVPVAAAAPKVAPAVGLAEAPKPAAPGPSPGAQVEKPAEMRAPPAKPETTPKLNPVLSLPGAQMAAGPSMARTFAFPVHEIYRLNRCLNWQSDCGEPAATAWCRAQGYARAVDWTADRNIGAVFPTVVLGARRICAQAFCDGFKDITCGP